MQETLGREAFYCLIKKYKSTESSFLRDWDSVNNKKEKISSLYKNQNKKLTLHKYTPSFPRFQPADWKLLGRVLSMQGNVEGLEPP